jgi:cell division septation protein DedD
MSDKLTAYRGEMFSSQQDGEAPQQNYGIDPNTGLPIQPGYGQQMDQQQGHPQGNLGYTGEGQVADQTYYQQQDAYQQPDVYQQQDPYQQQTPQDPLQSQQAGFQQGQYSQADYNQAQYGQQQYGQDQAAYGTQDQSLQQYQDPYQNGSHLNGTQGQYGQLDQSNAGLQADYTQQNQGYVEETDPYMAAHQNATLPYDPSSDALGQAGHSYGVAQDQQGYVQQYQDPNAGFSEYNPDQAAYAQQYQDPNAAYGDYQQGAVAGLPAPDAFGGAQQQYQDPNAGADYGSQYNNQGLQPLQNNAQPGMIGGGYGQQGVDPAVMAATQADANFDGEAQSSGRKSFLVGTMILGSVIIGGGVAFAYKYSGDGSSDNAPVITSEDSGIKSKPDNPGGREFAHKNKKIFARLGDPGAQTEAGIVASREPEVVESLRGEVKDAANQGQQLRETDSNGGPRRVRTYRIDRNGNQILDSGANRAKLAGQDVKDIPGVTADTGQPARTVRTLKANGAKKVQEKSIQIARAQAKAPPINRVASNDGNYVVQISARRTQTDALAAFSGLQSKYGSVLGGYRPLIQRADLGSRGIWFRLRVGPMQSREDAANVCAKLKNKGMKNCLVASR